MKRGRKELTETAEVWETRSMRKRTYYGVDDDVGYKELQMTKTED